MHYQGKYGGENELAGVLNIDYHNNNKIKGDEIEFNGDEMSATLPEGSVTFHKHTVLGDKKFPYMSTDVPSPTDIASIAIAILFRGAKEHLIFTPNFVFTISLYQETFDQMMRLANKTGLDSFEEHLRQELNKQYQKIQNQIGQNHGRSFVEKWLQFLKQYGININVGHYNEPLVFQLSPQSKNRNNRLIKQNRFISLYDYKPPTIHSKNKLIYKEKYIYLFIVGISSIFLLNTIFNSVKFKK